MRFCGQTRCCLGPSEKKEQKVIRRKREGERKREREREVMGWSTVKASSCIFIEVKMLARSLWYHSLSSAIEECHVEFFHCMTL